MAALAEAAASVRTAVDCRPHAPPTELAAPRGRQARPVRRSCGRSGYTSGAARSSRTTVMACSSAWATDSRPCPVQGIQGLLSSLATRRMRRPRFVRTRGMRTRASADASSSAAQLATAVQLELQPGKCHLIDMSVPSRRWNRWIQLRLVLSLGFVAANENQLDGRVVCHYRDGGPREASSQLVESCAVVAPSSPISVRMSSAL